MIRSILTTALTCALALAVLPAAAQIYPDSTGGRGHQVGMQSQNNSGQVGTVTLFGRGSKTLVVLDVHSAPSRSEPAHIHRGHTCDTLDPKPAYALTPVRRGHSSTLVNASFDRLVSGNYVVNVHSASDIAHYVSCGELYQ